MMERKEFERVSPEQEGISSAAIEKFIDALEESGTEMHGLMILRHKKVIAEGWWAPFSPGTIHGLQSLSKTYSATAVGIAVGEGLVKLEDYVADLFPEYLPEHPSEYLKKITVRDVLRMGNGMTEMPSMGDREWIRSYFATPVVYEPGTAFFYNSIGSSMLCAIVTKVTHMGVMEYLKPRLFDIIGIDASNVRWLRHPDGVENGGGGFFATTEDNARLAQLYLNRGMWEGKRVLSEDWVRQATSMQLHSYEDPGIPDCKLGYGFQMWMCRPQHGVYRFDGAYGQYAIVFPELDAIVSINETATLGAGAQKTLDLVWDVLMPAFGEPLPEDKAGAARLQKRLSCLSLPKPVFHPFSPLQSAVDHVNYKLDGTRASLLPPIYLQMTGLETPRAESFRLDFLPGKCILTWQEGNGQMTLGLGLDGRARLTEDVTDRVIPTKVFGNGFWKSESEFVAELRYVESCFQKKITFAFDRDKVCVTVDELQPPVGQMMPVTVFHIAGKAQR